MKSGANRTDQNLIARMYDDGNDAEYISRKLQIELNVIEAFKPEKKKSKSSNKLAENFDKP